MTLTKIKDAFAIMKNLVLESRAASESNKKEFDSKEIGNNSIELEKMNKQISDLKSSLVQRENEIAILVNMVKKGKTIQNVNGTLSQSYDRGDRSPRNSMVLDKQGISRNSSMTEDPRRLRSDQQNLPGDSWQGGESNHSSKIRSINIANEQREQQMMMAQAREKEKEERIVKKHLFGVPPPADPRIFEDAAGNTVAELMTLIMILYLIL